MGFAKPTPSLYVGLRQLSRTGLSGNPLFYTPALLLQDFAYSYRVWITLIKLLYAPLRPFFMPSIRMSFREELFSEAR